MALIDQNFVERREQLQHERFLAAIAHRAESPDLTLRCANATRQFQC